VWTKSCFTTLGQLYPAIHDSQAASDLPWSAVIGLSHTTDPLGWLVNHAFPGAEQAQSLARAARRDTSFRFVVLSRSLPPRQGGVPIVDADRYAALRGDYSPAPTDQARDYSVLLSCGPFRALAPGQSVEMDVALVAGENADSLRVASQGARLALRGTRLNLLPDANARSFWTVGETGINGHETCYTPPAGVDFSYDPNCTAKFVLDPAYRPQLEAGDLNPELIVEHHYQFGDSCVWSDFDCDACTGLDGSETVFPWFIQAAAPAQPAMRVTPGDREVTVEWDNLPDLLADAGVAPGAPSRFWGYRVYRLDDWKRESELPLTSRWQQLASFSVDTTLNSRPLADAINPAVDFDSIAYERKHYPIGRYRFVDDRVLDGFDYNYVVTAVTQRTLQIGSTPYPTYLESPFRAIASSTVRPRIEAAAGAGASRGGRVWVVPNPFKAHAPWERQPVPGDALTRHVDFFGLPRALSRIRIYTLAGDLVREISHDGTRGDGEAPWDLISRNGQEIESGVYLFTVDWPGGHQVGRFVAIR
jgi:hypothetical protein